MNEFKPSLILLIVLAADTLPAQSTGNPKPWTFVVSGDSRNCGDLIMPVIARHTRAAGALFYWHLGDLRALFKVDEDYAGLHRNDRAALAMEAYQKGAWDDFKKNQVSPFGSMPFFLGIGNHEIIDRKPQRFIDEFRSLLNIEPILRQRESDDKNDHTVRTYYHWSEPGADLINLDNSNSIFDDGQLKWAMRVIDADERRSDVKLLIIGMHESLPDSYSFDHSMNQGGDGGWSGRTLYRRLLEFREKTGRQVYVFSSHSHYYLANIYNTGTWQSNGGVLPGWLIGTAGAQHYSVPPEVKSFTSWAENEYGYGLVRVTPGGGPHSVEVQFVPVKRKDLDSRTESDFGSDAIDFCFSGNWRATLPGGP